MSEVLLLSRSDVAALLSFADCVEAVEAALVAQAEGRVLASAIASVAAPGEAGGDGGGAFHVKAGGIASRFVAKVNGNFPGNPRRNGLPTVQGVLVLADATDGRPLAVMDSIEITIRRTGAATAVAAKYLAMRDVHTATVCGCGVQGAIQAEALAHVLPLERILLCDADESRAVALAEALSLRLGIAAVARRDLREAVRESGAVVTCTTARAPILRAGDLAPGAFLAAVGADSPDKQELDPSLLAASRVVVDHIDQCAELGDLHHAIAAGAMRREDVAADLASVVSNRGSAAVRRSPDDTVVFDSTGIALEDVAAADVVYRRALESGRGMRWSPAA